MDGVQVMVSCSRYIAKKGNFFGYMHSGTHKTDSFMFLKKIPPIKNFKATVLHLFHSMHR